MKNARLKTPRIETWLHRYALLLRTFLDAIGESRIMSEVPSQLTYTQRAPRARQAEALAKYLGIPASTAKSYLKGERLPDHETHWRMFRLAAAVEHERIMLNEPFGFPCRSDVRMAIYPNMQFATGENDFRLLDGRVDSARLEHLWRFAAAESLSHSAFAEDESDLYMPWPTFLYFYKQGIIEEQRTVRIGIDGSGFGQMRTSIMRPAVNGKLNNQPKCVVEYEGELHFALQTQFAPNAKAGRSLNLLSEQSCWAGSPASTLIEWSPQRTYRGKQVMLSEVRVIWVEERSREEHASRSGSTTKGDRNKLVR